MGNVDSVMVHPGPAPSMAALVDLASNSNPGPSTTRDRRQGRNSGGSLSHISERSKFVHHLPGFVTNRNGSNSTMACNGNRPQKTGRLRTVFVRTNATDSVSTFAQSDKFIDYMGHRHIIKQIIKYADHDTLIQLRAVSRALKAQVDSLLHRHILLSDHSSNRDKAKVGNKAVTISAVSPGGNAGTLARLRQSTGFLSSPLHRNLLKPKHQVRLQNLLATAQVVDALGGLNALRNTNTYPTPNYNARTVRLFAGRYGTYPPHCPVSCETLIIDMDLNLERNRLDVGLQSLWSHQRYPDVQNGTSLVVFTLHSFAKVHLKPIINDLAVNAARQHMFPSSVKRIVFIILVPPGAEAISDDAAVLATIPANTWGKGWWDMVANPTLVLAGNSPNAEITFVVGHSENEGWTPPDESERQRCAEAARESLEGMWTRGRQSLNRFTPQEMVNLVGERAWEVVTLEEYRSRVPRAAYELQKGAMFVRHRKRYMLLQPSMSQPS